MSKNEIVSMIETMNNYDELASKAKAKADAIRDALTLELPLRVLCKEDCKGLCPKCGHNLNEGPCGCDLREEDPRWDALKSLLQNQDRHGMEQEV